MGMSVPGNSCRTNTRCWAPNTGAGCLVTLPGTCVYYSGAHITAPGINTGDLFNVVVNKLVTYISGSLTTAEEGLIAEEGTVMLGQEFGEVSDPAAITISREIPMNDSTELQFRSTTESDNGFPRFSVTPNKLQLYGSFNNEIDPAIEFIDMDGARGGIIEANTDYFGVNGGGTGLYVATVGDFITLSTGLAAQFDIGDLVTIDGGLAVNGYSKHRYKTDDNVTDSSPLPQESNAVYTSLIAKTVFLPAANMFGLTYHVIIGETGQTITIEPNGTDTIHIGPLNGGAGGAVSSSTEGNAVTLVCVELGNWHALSFIGTWS